MTDVRKKAFDNFIQNVKHYEVPGIVREEDVQELRQWLLCSQGHSTEYKPKNLWDRYKVLLRQTLKLNPVIIKVVT